MSPLKSHWSDISTYCPPESQIIQICRIQIWLIITYVICSRETEADRWSECRRQGIMVSKTNGLPRLNFERGFCYWELLRIRLYFYANKITDSLWRSLVFRSIKLLPKRLWSGFFICVLLWSRLQQKHNSFRNWTRQNPDHVVFFSVHAGIGNGVSACLIVLRHRLTVFS